jgi:hypothetical protein
MELGANERSPLRQGSAFCVNAVCCQVVRYGQPDQDDADDDKANSLIIFSQSSTR